MREFLPAVSWALTPWDVPEFGILIDFEGVSLLVSREKDRFKVFLQSLSSRTGRGLLRLSTDEFLGDVSNTSIQEQSSEMRSEQPWRQKIRDFALVHRHGIVWIDDAVECPREWLSTSTDYGHAQLGLKVDERGRLENLRTSSRTDSWDWAPGNHRPCIDWQSIEQMWVIATIHIPANFPSEAIVLKKGRISNRESFANAFPEPSRERVSWLMRRWEFAYYMPTVSELHPAGAQSNE
jgi:hypothetical protein